MLIDNITSITELNVQNVQKLENSDSNTQETDGGKPNDQMQIKAVDTSGQHERSVSNDELQKSIDKILKTVEGDSTSLKFDIHKDTNTIMVKVIDNDTQKVIREIPPEKILDMIASIWKLVGIIVDKKA